MRAPEPGLRWGRLLLPTGALLVILASGCSLDYGEASVAEEIQGETPQTVLSSFTHTIVSQDRVWVVLEADRAETYEKRKEIVLTNAHLREFDSQGELTTEAWAEEAVFYTDSENATVRGSIRIYSPKEKARLQAQALTWTKDGKRLVADAGDTVRVDKDDGSFLQGGGFSADFRRRTITFVGGVQGRYVQEEDRDQ
jgi:LPS export ABC transporter protein LptC